MVEQVIKYGLHAMNNFGIGFMAGEVAKALTPENANTVVKACIYVGGVAAGGAVATRADAYIDKCWDDTKELIKGIKKVSTAKKEQKNKVEDPVEEVKEVVEEDKLEKIKKELEEAKKNDPMKDEVEKLKKKTKKRVEGM